MRPLVLTRPSLLMILIPLVLVHCHCDAGVAVILKSCQSSDEYVSGSGGWHKV